LRRGFTLTEIILAFSVLLAGTVGIYALFAVGIVSHKRAVDRTDAALLAGSIFDDIAANYDVFYYDDNNNGRPDLSEDRNGNGTDDWFESSATGAAARPMVPVPWRFGMIWQVEYQRSEQAPGTLWVTVTINRAQGEAGRGSEEVFSRAVYVPSLSWQPPPEVGE